MSEAEQVEFRTVDPTGVDARACLDAYFAELDERFPTGFDSTGATENDAIAHTPPNGIFLVVYEGDRPIGCGGVTTLEDGVGEIKRMWIDEPVRGRGLGAKLLLELEDQSRALGHRIVRLDTNTVLMAARSMYASRGYREIERYNDNPFARHWFEKSLD